MKDGRLKSVLEATKSPTRIEMVKTHERTNDQKPRSQIANQARKKLATVAGENPPQDAHNNKDPSCPCAPRKVDFSGTKYAWKKDKKRSPPATTGT